MRRFAFYSSGLLAITLVFGPYSVCATTWKLVLKNGKTIECDGAPIIVNDAYLFRTTEGKDSTLPAEQVDRDKTDRANKIASAPRQWPIISESVNEQPPARRSVGEPAKKPPVAAPSTASQHVLNFSDAGFDTQVLNSRTPVLVVFWATWCRYCKKMAPAIDAIADEYAGRLTVGKLDIDQNPVTPGRYGIRGTPTLLLFKQGQAVGGIDGAAEKFEVVQMLQSRL
jgi:thioredoxin 1